MGFKGSRCLITGGSSGIGLALAQLLAAEGADLWLLASGADRLELAGELVRTQRASPDQIVETIQADVTDADEVQSALLPMIDRAGAPDVLVNSAGVARPGYVEELPLDVFHRMMDVNYFGTVNVTQTMLPAMLARRRGHIVNLASLAAVIGVFGYTAYGASKFAVRGYSDALRAELKPHGLRVSIAYPPDTDTPQLAYENRFKPPETKALGSSGGTMQPEAVARSILRGVERRRYLLLPGLEAKVLFWVAGALGPLAFPVMDLVVARARARRRATPGSH
jgi:3-dehydrosphinganine reductase